MKELSIALIGRPSRSLMLAAHLLHGEMDNTIYPPPFCVLTDHNYFGRLFQGMNQNEQGSCSSMIRCTVLQKKSERGYG